MSQILYRCADVTNLPLGCSQVKLAGECCAKIQCSNGQTGTFQGSQTQPGTIGGYPVPTLIPTPAPTPGPGQTFAPGTRPTPPVINSLGTVTIMVFIMCACRSYLLIISFNSFFAAYELC